MGTRPEAIKLAPVIFELGRHGKDFKADVVWTGQHLTLARPFLELFQIKPAFHFDVMQKNQSLADTANRILKKLDPLFKRERPDMVLVQGDTTTAFIATLCAFYNKIPVAHVEAGLRTGNPHQPFPEEKNRELVSHLASLHFAPTRISKKNLLDEGVDPDSIFVVGNSVVDALMWLVKRYPPPRTKTDVKTLLVTLHRRESFGTPLKNICDAIASLVKRNRDLKVIFPVHPNPNVKKTVTNKLGGVKQIRLMSPLDYVSFIHHLSNCSAVLTDSGGIQEEAPCLGKIALVVRDVTERPEGIAAGSNILVGREPRNIIAQVERVLYNKKKLSCSARFPFGKGDTAKKIVKILKRYV